MATIPFWGSAIPLERTDQDPSLVIPADASPWDLLDVPDMDVGGNSYNPNTGRWCLPGLVKIHALPELKKDLKAVVGADGGTTTIVGTKPSAAEMMLTIWLPSQWDIWCKVRPKLLARPGKFFNAAYRTGGPAPWKVFNPVFADAGIRAIYFETIGTPVTRGSPSDIRDIKIRWEEFSPVQGKTVSKQAGPVTNQKQGNALTKAAPGQAAASPSATQALQTNGITGCPFLGSS